MKKHALFGKAKKVPQVKRFKGKTAIGVVKPGALKGLMQPVQRMPKKRYRL